MKQGYRNSLNYFLMKTFGLNITREIFTSGIIVNSSLKKLKNFLVEMVLKLRKLNMLILIWEICRGKDF